MANNNQNNNNNNNFFNKNPLLTFIIFAIIVILAFKVIAPQTNGQSSSITNQFSKETKISYSGLKDLIKANKITFVGIGNHLIKAKTTDGTMLTT